jgi:hypothetical protein
MSTTTVIVSSQLASLGKNEIEIRQTFFSNIKRCQKIRATHKTRKNKIYGSGTEKQFKTK